MNSIMRRIQKLEVSLLPAPESEQDRILRERMNAARRRVDEARARGELDPQSNSPLAALCQLRLLQARIGYRRAHEVLKLNRRIEGVIS